MNSPTVSILASWVKEDSVAPIVGYTSNPNYQEEGELRQLICGRNRHLTPGYGETPPLRFVRWKMLRAVNTLVSVLALSVKLPKIGFDLSTISLRPLIRGW